MLHRRRIGWRRFVAIAGVAALLVSGCTPGDQPKQKPTAPPAEPGVVLTPIRGQSVVVGALDNLAKASAVRYRGAAEIGGRSAKVDLRVTRSGLALGTVEDASTELKVLAVDDKTFVRADRAFWKKYAAPGESEQAKASYLAKRWVAVDPSAVGDPSDTLRPSALATFLQRSVQREGVSQIRDATVRGIRALAVSSGETTYYVSRSAPHRLLRTHKPPEFRVVPNRGSGGATILPAVQEGEAGEDDEGFETDDLGAEAVDDIYDSAQREAPRLRGSVDSRVRFDTRTTPNFQCSSATFTCNASILVSNTVQGGADVTRISGTVQATLRGSIVASGLGSQPCQDAATMQPNGSATMRCSASFPKPPPSRNPRTYRVVGTFFVTAGANLNVERIVRELRQDRANDTRPKIGSSKQLGRNLAEVLGEQPRRGPDGKLLDEAAHLVPRPTGSGTANYPAAQRARQILDRYDIDIDDPVNGKWLPRSGRTAGGKATHGSTHSKRYLDALYERLRKCQDRQCVEEVLDFVKRQLEKGPWPP